MMSSKMHVCGAVAMEIPNATVNRIAQTTKTGRHRMDEGAEVASGSMI